MNSSMNDTIGVKKEKKKLNFYCNLCKKYHLTINAPSWRIPSGFFLNMILSDNPLFLMIPLLHNSSKWLS
jgi:hypothetical protein